MQYLTLVLSNKLAYPLWGFRQDYFIKGYLNCNLDSNDDIQQNRLNILT